MMKRLFPILMLSAVALLGACAKDGVGNQTESSDSQSVTFTANIPQRGVTRGTPITKASDLKSMGVFCAYTGTADWTSAAPMNKMDNQRLDNVSGTWTYPSGQEKYWEAETFNDRFSFFAYAPFATGSNGITVGASTTGTPKLTYTVPSNVVEQPDLMVAVPRKNVRPMGGSVTMDMKHALTCVGFQVAGTVAGTKDKITNIAITGVSVKETLSIDGSNIVWSSTGAKTTAAFTASINFDDDPDNPGSKLDYFTVTEDMSGVGTRPSLIASDGYLMMIPQTLGEDAWIELTVYNGVEEEQVLISLNGHSWAAGKYVNYHITLDSSESPFLDYDLGPMTWYKAFPADKPHSQGACPDGYYIPSQNELQMIGINLPGLHGPNFSEGYAHWSATEYPHYDEGFSIELGRGRSSRDHKANECYVRCVKVVEKDPDAVTYPYVDISDLGYGPIIVCRDADGGIAKGSIHENWTEMPEIHNETSPLNKVSAKLQVANRDLFVIADIMDWETARMDCPYGWRLPTQREQMLIAVMGGGGKSSDTNPPLDTTNPLYDVPGFTILKGPGAYWSATEYNSLGRESAWSMSFINNAIMDYNEKGHEAHVRCVRDVD